MTLPQSAPPAAPCTTVAVKGGGSSIAIALPHMRPFAAPDRSEGAARLHTPPPNRRAYRALRRLARPLMRTAFGMRGTGMEHLPAAGPYLLAYNHVTMLDWAFVSYFLAEPVRFLVDRDYHDRRLLRPAMRLNGAIPAYTDRPDPEAMRRARAVLAAGEPLVVTPEGRISRDGRPGRARPGIIALSASLRVPIVPAAIRGAFDAFPRHRRLPRPRPVGVVFAAPLPPPMAPDRATQRALADRLMAYIAALLDGAADPPRPW